MRESRVPQPLARILEAGAIALVQGLVAWGLEIVKAHSKPKELVMPTPEAAQPQGILTVSVRLVDPPPVERGHPQPRREPDEPEGDPQVDPRVRHTPDSEPRRRTGPPANREQRPT